ncbi:MAG: CAP domain-containing protein [Chloroflexi bacterium]|nr:CAP domain-containing protein [Chloroflexota bacterium]
MTRPFAYWAAFLLLLAAATPAFAQAEGVGQAAANELNRYRAAAGLDTVVVDAQSAAPLHARYLALNRDSAATSGLLAHTEQAGLPGYSPEGATVAQRSNISEGASTVEEAVRRLVDLPLHRHWMLAPALSALGAGGEGNYWVLDLATALQPWRGQPRVVAFPAPGQLGVGLVFPGHEIPNPLAAIPNLDPNATVGYPLSLHFFGCRPTGAGASLSSASGPVPTYLVPPGTVLEVGGITRTVDFVLLFPQRPLQPSTTYHASFSATCGALGQRTYDWTFTTHAALEPTATQVAVGPPDGAGWQSVAARLLDADRLPAEGAHFTGARWSYRLARGGGRPPEFHLERGQALGDGTLAATFNLHDATSADLQLQVDYDGLAATIPVQVLPAGSGQLPPAPAPGPIRLDPSARAAWEQAQGATVVGSLAPAAAATPLTTLAPQPAPLASEPEVPAEPEPPEEVLEE